MTSDDLSEDVTVGIGPLIQVAGPGGTEEGRICAADVINIVLRQSKRRLRIAGNLVPTPACGIGTRLVQQAGRECVSPDQRKGVVDLCVMPEVHRTDSAVVIRG